MAAWNERAAAGLRHPVLDAVRDVPGVWIVGGAVRDVLLGGEPREFDLVVEGDAEAVARLLDPPTPPVLHERFGTATVGAVDVASARTETYPEPGALPEVTLGATIEADLARRDFTVNTFAVRLSDGAGACWPSAKDDLERGQLRVLHDDSFTDDPTRVLRMARYAARLGFNPDPHTAALAAEARFATVSGERVGAEVRLALAEPLPEVLLALDDADLGKRALHPAYAADGAFLERVLAEVPLGAVPGLAALGACLLDAPDVPGVLHRLGFPAAERAIVSAVAGGARHLAEGLLAATTPSEAANVARRKPAEALAVAAALGARDPVHRWLDEWRHVRAQINGEDLLAAGLTGPSVGVGLRAALAAALDGEAPDRATQLEVALQSNRPFLR